MYLYQPRTAALRPQCHTRRFLPICKYERDPGYPRTRRSELASESLHVRMTQREPPMVKMAIIPVRLIYKNILLLMCSEKCGEMIKIFKLAINGVAGMQTQATYVLSGLVTVGSHLLVGRLTAFDRNTEKL